MPILAIDAASYQLHRSHPRTVPLILWTDESDQQQLPARLRDAADEVRYLDSVDPSTPPQLANCGGVLWRKQESLRQGTASQLRFSVTTPGRRFFVPVHFQCTADFDLIGLEPRWYSPAGSGAWEDNLDLRFRVNADRMQASQPAENSESWAQLSTELRKESIQPGSGVPSLARLLKNQSLHPLLASLILRNLAVTLMAQHEWGTARDLLNQGSEIYPNYRELSYLQARLAIATGKGEEAMKWLHRATTSTTDVFVGSGGESTYRPHYLLSLMAEQCGQQRVAVHHFLTGVQATPAYLPSVTGILRQRVAQELLERVQGALLALARREPQYVRPVVDFLLLHRAWNAARRLLDISMMPDTQRAHLEQRLESLAPLYRPTPRAAAAPGVVLSGPFLTYSSLARVNRHVGRGLLRDTQLDVALHQTSAGNERLADFPGHETLAAGLARLPRRLDLTIRHVWPHDFVRPTAGKLAVILPWEFNAIPQSWRQGLEGVAEVWTPSRFVARALTSAGMDPERVVVIPSAIDPRMYSPNGESYRPPGSRSFCFLFVGGAIRRKGMDLLLRAWHQAFGPDDDVTLVIKDIGSNSFYRHLSLREDIENLSRNPSVAPIQYLGDDWTDARLPTLYRGCDVLVLPYRGEGFGLPLLEALACGKPVITTDSGPAPEFCPPGATLFVPADEVEVPADMLPSSPMTAPLTWFEPRLPALVDALRQAHRDAADLPRRGAIAAAHVRRHYSWEAVVARYRDRIQAVA